MTVYRDVGVAIARVMSIEANDGTAKQQWQRMRLAGFPEEPPQRMGEALSPEERMAQDSMVRARLHRELSDLQWHALVAKYSINDKEVAESVKWLVSRVVSPAHHLFKMKCVVAWAIPKKRGAKDGGKTSRQGLPDSFYDVSSWDADGTPDRTLRHWRTVTVRWLESQVSAGFDAALPILEEAGLVGSMDA